MQAETISTQLVVAAVLSSMIDKVKATSWFPWVTVETEKVNRYFTGFVAALGTIGIALACSATDRTCTLTWPDLHTFGHGLLLWAQQWAILHGWWKVTK